MQRFTFFICLFLFSVPSASSQTTLTFEIENAANDSCYIAYYYGDKQYIVGDEGVNQTLYLDGKGKGKFVRSEMKEGVYMIVFPPNNNYVEFLFEGENASFKFDKNDPVNTLEVKNAPGTALMYRDIRYMSDLQEKYPNWKEDSQQGAQFSEGRDRFRDSIKAKDPNNFYVKLLKLNSDPKVPEDVTEKGRYAGYYYFKKHYFDEVPFGEQWILQSPTYHAKVMAYMDRLTSSNYDSIMQSVDLILSLANKNQEVFKYTLITLFNKYATSKTMGHDGVYVHMAKKYYLSGVADWVDEEQLEKIKERVSQLEYTLIGMKAKDVQYEALNGLPHSLYETSGTYTILVFSDPDCGHCKDMAEDLKSQMDSIPPNTEVLAINLNVNLKDMYQVTKERDYTWKNAVLNEEQAALVRRYYDLRSMPKVYVLDPDKIIVGKQISIEQAIGLIRDLQE